MHPSKAPLISVILPFLNAEKWLGEALASVLAQDCADLEVIAIDDGSSDASAWQVEQAGQAGLPVTLIRNETNLGIVASLNRGLDVARGRYIARMDADDVCLPHRFSRQLAYLRSTGVDLCGSWFVEFGQGPRRTTRWPHTEAALRAAMLFQNTICHPTILARREVFDRFRYREDYRLAEDYDLFVRAGSEFRLANVPEPLLRYRRHPQQATQARRSAMEEVTRRIRGEALRAQSIEVAPEELRLHNLIRAPSSIECADDLHGIEAWLLKLLDTRTDEDARHVVASQWVRACIRAAPLGQTMWRAFRSSPLYELHGGGLATSVDMYLLSLCRLSYASKPFATLRRLGLSS
ncbi:glycosyltransferase family 2 protein [Frateuria sp. GZRR33]|uniref:glycosyltransferase family 2 protein n=1 Tax=Frateuria sp. GZRR33 TaxID=3351535 RepID=UPI003EDBDED4